MLLVSLVLYYVHCLSFYYLVFVSRRWLGPGEVSGAVLFRFITFDGYFMGNGGIQGMLRSIISKNSSSIRQARFIRPEVNVWFEYVSELRLRYNFFLFIIYASFFSKNCIENKGNYCSLESLSILFCDNFLILF